MSKQQSFTHRKQRKTHRVFDQRKRFGKKQLFPRTRHKSLSSTNKNVHPFWTEHLQNCHSPSQNLLFAKLAAISAIFGGSSEKDAKLVSYDCVSVITVSISRNSILLILTQFLHLYLMIHGAFPNSIIQPKFKPSILTQFRNAQAYAPAFVSNAPLALLDTI
jgi:hypothetical protein